MDALNTKDAHILKLFKTTKVPVIKEDHFIHPFQFPSLFMNYKTN